MDIKSVLITGKKIGKTVGPIALEVFLYILKKKEREKEERERAQREIKNNNK